MDTTAWISLAAISISGLSLFAHRLTRRKPRHDASDQHVCGDCPFIHDELKVGRHWGAPK
jgi:hypothetical protein